MLLICVRCHCQKSAWQAPQMCTYIISALFIQKKMEWIAISPLCLCSLFRKVGDDVTWNFPPTIMSHLISASVCLRFVLNIVTSCHSWRWEPHALRRVSWPQFAVITHFSWHTSRNYAPRAFCCQSEGLFIFWELLTVIVGFLLRR
jgi:hypothetical protein